MFWKRNKKEEPSVAFQIGEAMGKYTDLVIEQLKAKQDEIDRLNAIINSTNNTEIEK